MTIIFEFAIIAQFIPCFLACKLWFILEGKRQKDNVSGFLLVSMGHK